MRGYGDTEVGVRLLLLGAMGVEQPIALAPDPFIPGRWLAAFPDQVTICVYVGDHPRAPDLEMIGG